jgi:hypothetical protein
MLRSEEPDLYQGDEDRSKAHLFLGGGAACLLLCCLNIARFATMRVELDVLERARERFLLSQDISYLISGEWIAQVRWLATFKDAGYRWVSNMNSDVAVFGVAANLGWPVAALASLLLLSVAATAVVASDQARRAAGASANKKSAAPATWCRGLGLFLGAVAVLLISQWLVHLSTGVALRLPITGLVFPWISHGNTTHLVYTAAFFGPLALLCWLAELMPLLEESRQE